MKKMSVLVVATMLIFGFCEVTSACWRLYAKK